MDSINLHAVHSFQETLGLNFCHRLNSLYNDFVSAENSLGTTLHSQKMRRGKLERANKNKDRQGRAGEVQHEQVA